ncbi:unnamed protein product [Rotaria sordida]|uniref:Tc1-like transposase DDE domain-containing protein n=1 Tax=Rotaria sordida TaxID=392033 RepID=A0A815APM7_9BILA|nr:unnamed protein product [Rotaria sordida]
MNEQQQQQQETKENDEVDANVRGLRSRTISLPMFRHRESSASAPPAKILCRRHTISAASSSSHVDLPIPQALPPQKKGNRFIPLLKQQQGKDLIRFEFHKLIQEKVYPTSEKLLKRLIERYEDFPIRSATELLQPVCTNCPPKEYMSDCIAKKYAVEIIRLPKLHCSLNPIELSWNNIKQFVRDQNTTFRQNDVEELIKQFMMAMDDKLASSYFHHVYKVEEMYRTADEIMEEEIEPHIQSETEETNSDDDKENME